MNPFVQGYLEAALWVEQDSEGRSFYGRRSVEDVDPDSLSAMEREVLTFVKENKVDVDELLTDNPDFDPTCVGYWFWMNRNNQGTGFWAHGFGSLGERLSRAARGWGECSLWEEDELFYQSNSHQPSRNGTER